MTPFTVLITSAGRRVGLANCFRDAGMRLGIPVRVLAADLVPDLSAACAIADAAYALPRVTEPGYIDAVSEICAREGVALVVPTIDPELLAFAEAADHLAANGTRAHVSAPETIAIARDKLRTALVLGANGIAVPDGASPEAAHIGTQALPFPLIAKPRGGSSSIGLRIVENEADVAALDANEHYIVQQKLSGPEFTVNIFIDRQGELRAAVPHRRIETRAGEVSKGRTERHDAMTAVAAKLAKALPGARGALCFQCFLTDLGPVVFEINARFGGGYPLAHAAGARFTQWLIEEELGIPPTTSDTWQDGLLMLRHDSEIFR